MIEYRSVSKKYNDIKVIKDISFTIEDGEFVVLIGPSGCGKTTTLKMLNRLIPMDGGDILIDGKSIKEVQPETLRRNIGYVIQQIGLFPNMTIEENICVVPKLLKWSKERCHKRAKELLELVSLPYKEYAHKYPNEFSGGQQQRIGVLRALAAEPPIILMDEPFGALDPITRDNLQDEVKDLQKKLHKTIIFVTHDMDEAIKLADKIIFMNKGRILQIASPEEMLRNPADPMISDFMGKLSYSPSGNDLTCEDVMKKKVFTVPENKKILESVTLMRQRELDSAVVIDENKKYKGVVTIESIKEKGRPGEEVSKIMDTNVPTVLLNTNARDAFDLLIETKADYLIVLNRDKTVAGIITKTSMTKALASVIWGDEN
ncbi:ABC transporter ATP-binding protein [Garciella nitratireducens]|uniref:betaine/proline/choline family ABC transporter ATP-binding protein n=1 Tax=Garciella nitratireducens TaxID=218205 RepID=UPI000DEAFD5D|nr:ABC transporter ATP-binding protein [Garciella nitratireducens]RBP41576.1 osmoprotectant transport system ATP-binding protein [Garciella nitratireducens]